MDLTVSHCFIAVDDHDKALGFYRDVLGLQVRNDVSFEGMRWLTLFPATQPEMEIVIVTPATFPNASDADKQVIAEFISKGVMPGLIFNTNDCDATFEHVRASGADVTQEPIDQPYGVRDCGFRDPAGNMLRFSQPKS